MSDSLSIFSSIATGRFGSSTVLGCSPVCTRLRSRSLCSNTHLPGRKPPSLATDFSSLFSPPPSHYALSKSLFSTGYRSSSSSSSPISPPPPPSHSGAKNASRALPITPPSFGSSSSAPKPPGSSSSSASSSPSPAASRISSSSPSTSRASPDLPPGGPEGGRSRTPIAFIGIFGGVAALGAFGLYLDPEDEKMKQSRGEGLPSSVLKIMDRSVVPMIRSLYRPNQPQPSTQEVLSLSSLSPPNPSSSSLYSSPLSSTATRSPITSTSSPIAVSSSMTAAGTSTSPLSGSSPSSSSSATTISPFSSPSSSFSSPASSPTSSLSSSSSSLLLSTPLVSSTQSSSSSASSSVPLAPVSTLPSTSNAPTSSTSSESASTIEPPITEKQTSSSLDSSLSPDSLRSTKAKLILKDLLANPFEKDDGGLEGQTLSKAIVAERWSEAVEQLEEGVVRALREVETEVEIRKDNEMKKKMEKTLSGQRGALEAAFTQKRKQLEVEWRDKAKLELRQQQDTLDKILAEERGKTLAQLADLKGQLGAMDELFDEELARKLRAHEASKLLVASVAVEQALSSGRPAADQLAMLKQMGRSDVLTEWLISSLPIDLVEALHKPVPTQAQLQDSFRRVCEECLRAAFVPPGWGLLGHVVGSLFASMYILEKDPTEYGHNAYHAAGPIEPAYCVKRNLDRMQSAWYHVDKGEVQEALRYVDELDGLCGDVAHEWRSQARQSLILQQTLQAVRQRILRVHQLLSM